MVTTAERTRTIPRGDDPRVIRIGQGHGSFVYNASGASWGDAVLSPEGPALSKGIKDLLALSNLSYRQSICCHPADVAILQRLWPDAEDWTIAEMHPQP